MVQAKNGEGPAQWRLMRKRADAAQNVWKSLDHAEKLIKDHDAPKNTWRMARVLEVNCNARGQAMFESEGDKSTSAAQKTEMSSGPRRSKRLQKLKTRD